MMSKAVVAVMVLVGVGSAASAQVSPIENAVLSRTEVRLTWPTGPAGVDYDVEIALDAAGGFDEPILSQTVPVPALLVRDVLAFGSSYRWRYRTRTGGVPAEWSESAFSIRSIPFDFQLDVAIETGPGTPSPGITVFNHCRNIVGFDTDGQLVLLVDTPARVSDCKVIPDERLLFVGGGQAWILSLDGDLLWSSPDSPDLRVHHCASMMPNGDVLMVIREYRDITQDGVTRNWQGDRIVQMNIETNEIVWEWSTFEAFTTIDYDVFQTNYWNDWTHINDAHYVAADNSIYVSVRHLSRITRIDYDTREIVYNLGMDMPSGEVPVGDDLFSYMHSPMLLDNGNMVLFDNGNRRGGQPAGSDGFTRAIEIEFTGMPPTDAQIVWSWQPPLYCPSTGDADRLPNGNTLVTSTQLRGIYEVTPLGAVAWKLDMVQIESCPGLRPGYRSTRVESLIVDPIAPCPADLDGSGAVDVNDLLSLLAQWGQSGTADLDGDGTVAVNDLLTMLEVWGGC